MIRREVGLALLAVILPCVVLSLMSVQLHMMPERTQISTELQKFRNELWDKHSALSQEVEKQGKRLASIEEVLEKVRSGDEHATQSLLEIRGILERLAPGAPDQHGGVASPATVAPALQKTETAYATAEDIVAAEIERLMNKWKCPEHFPYPFKADDLLIPNRCCSQPTNCLGQPISKTKDFECCGGAEASMPITYNYTAPEGGPVACEKLDWWAKLDEKAGPFWVTMKALADDASRPKGAGHSPDAPAFWAGGADSALTEADVDRARQYVGSAWGRSGWRQFETARKFMGLEPQHHFLEVGCGALNAGQFFMSFLDGQHYVCVEPNTVLHNLSAAESVTLQGNISRKGPVFVPRDDFDPRPKVPQRLFERSWSHSVLSHAADWQLMQYFEVMAAVLAPKTGIGMASIRFSDGTGTLENPTHDSSWVYPGVSYFDFAEARCMARKAGLELRLLPEARLFMTEVVPAEMHDWIWMRRV